MCQQAQGWEGGGESAGQVGPLRCQALGSREGRMGVTGGDVRVPSRKQMRTVRRRTRLERFWVVAVALRRRCETIRDGISRHLRLFISPMVSGSTTVLPGVLLDGGHSLVVPRWRGALARTLQISRYHPSKACGAGPRNTTMSVPFAEGAAPRYGSPSDM